MKTLLLALMALFVCSEASAFAPPPPPPPWQPPAAVPSAPTPSRLSICYRFSPDGDSGQCGGASGVHCTPLNEWSSEIRIDTDDRAGGCEQQFSVRKANPTPQEKSLRLCVDFNPDGQSQCDNPGTHCAGLNGWTDTYRIDTDSRPGGCQQGFRLDGGDPNLVFEVQYRADGDSSQCELPEHDIVLYRSEGGDWSPYLRIDTDSRSGGCLQKFRIGDSPSPPPISPTPNNTSAATFLWSINLHPEDVDYDIGQANSAFDEIVRLGAGMVRFDIPWSDIEPERGASDLSKWNFFEDFVEAAAAHGLKPMVVLARQPQWALDLYRSDPSAYWNEWRGYIKSVACQLGNSIYYYQISNESNAPNDPIDASDDWKKFAGIHGVIASCDKQFETIVNAYSNWIDWEPALTDWIQKAGKDIDIIGVDHYPSTFTGTDGTDWYPLDTLIARTNDPNDAWHGKKGAIIETGYSTWSGMNAHGDADQQNWIDNYAMKTILNKVKANNQSPSTHKIVLANFYELYDLNSGSFFCGDSLWFGCSWDVIGLINDHFGVLRSDRTEKVAFASLKNQIKKFNDAAITTVRLSCNDSSDYDSAGDPCIHNDCFDYSAADDVGDACNHNDCPDKSLRDDVLDPCDHNDCADGSLRDNTGDACNHNDCSDGSLEDGAGNACIHNDCQDGSPEDQIGNPCIHNDCPDNSLQDSVGSPCNHNDCPDNSLRDNAGDPCNHNDCPDSSPRDGVGDACNHNDCSDGTLQDSVGDACNHNDCPDSSPQDGVGDACNHEDCLDGSLQDGLGDACNHNDCSDGSPQDDIGDPCNHNDCVAQPTLCYEFTGDVGGQCGGSTGVQCAPLGEWTPSMLIDTDNR
ncbi:MAG: hypothetical protein WC690_09220, partial [bacterium]